MLRERSEAHPGIATEWQKICTPESEIGNLDGILMCKPILALATGATAMPHHPSDPRKLDINWHETMPRVYDYARAVAYREPNSGDFGCELAHEAVAQFLSGRRIWKPERCTAVQFFCGVVRSIYSHYRNSPAVRLCDYVDANDEKIVIMDDAAELESKRVEYMEMCEIIIAFMYKKKPKVAVYVEHIFRDPDMKNADAALVMNVNITEID